MRPRYQIWSSVLCCFAAAAPSSGLHRVNSDCCNVSNDVSARFGCTPNSRLGRRPERFVSEVPISAASTCSKVCLQRVADHPMTTDFERLRGLQIDHQIELGGLLDGNSLAHERRDVRLDAFEADY